MTAHAVFLVLAVAGWISLAIWVVLLVGRGGFWRMDLRLPEAPADGDGDGGGRAWPSVTAVIPARDEAGILPATLPSVLAQDYPGPFSVIVVDDASTDGTGRVAAELAEAMPSASGCAPLHVLRGSGPPPGWAGKVAAMDRGLRAVDDIDEIDDETEYVLFTDSDIAHPADSLRRLVRHAQDSELDLVSLMARLSTDSAAERVIVPAFVFSFFQLYPPAWVNNPTARTAAAAGGCMLVRRQALEDAGGLAGIADARIDDVALGTLLKRGGRGGGNGGESSSDGGGTGGSDGGTDSGSRGRTDSGSRGGSGDGSASSEDSNCRSGCSGGSGSEDIGVGEGSASASSSSDGSSSSGFIRDDGSGGGSREGGNGGGGSSSSSSSRENYGRVWLGVTTGVRSLRPYPRLADLWDMIARSAYTQLRYSPWLLLGTIVGLVLTYGVPPIVGVVGLATQRWGVAIPALAAWGVMSAVYVPVLRLYGLRWWRAPLLPGVMAVYGAMTIDSARRHWQGRGGAWKGRMIESGE